MMVRKYPIFFFLIKLSFFVSGQSQDTVQLFRLDYHLGDIKFMSYVDGQKNTLKSMLSDKNAAIPGNGLVFLKDTSRIRSFPSKVEVKNIVMPDKPMVLIVKNPAIEGYESVYQLLNLMDGELIDLDIRGYILSYFNGNLIGGEFNLAKYDGYGDYISQLKQFSIDKRESASLFELESTPGEAEGILSVYPFKKNNLLIIKQAYCYTPLTGCETSKSFVFDINTYKLSERQNDPFVKEALLNFIELSGNYHLVKSSRNFFLYSATGEVSPVLSRRFQVKGWNYENGKVQSYAVLSSLDARKYKSGRTLKEVIIPYKLTYQLETSLYNVYQDKEINSTLLKGFGLYELLILKNMIFAKHNYAFDKPFYQAYFNLFEFYNDEKERASRTKDMTGLLTGADTKNLQVIRKALEKFD